MKLTILLSLTAGLALVLGQTTTARGVEQDVMKADEAYRVAKLHQDLKALDGILADEFNETNQNGNSRDKAQTLELWKDFSITSLTTDNYQVRLTGNTATINGTQTENGNERMLFTRVYVKRGSEWKLLSSIQFRDPNPPGVSPAEAAVMKVDEEYRVGKLRQDLKAMNRILADDFYGVNQWGHARNKGEIIELWKVFSISSLTTDNYRVRINGDTAMVTGTQTENGTDRMLFTRVYIQRSGVWQLLSSTQYLTSTTTNDAMR